VGTVFSVKGSVPLVNADKVIEHQRAKEKKLQNIKESHNILYAAWVCGID
jgi:hypothetical protein